MMRWYNEYFLPWAVDRVMRADAFSVIRRKYLADLRGTVLEIGFGSGLNLPHYPLSVEQLLALDPSHRGRRIAADRIEQFRRPVRFIDWKDGRLALADGQVDGIVTTWTLCTIPDVEGTLRECHRVLKDGGVYVFVEHGRSPDATVSRWQDRWNPFQKIFAGGCHVNRPIDRLLRSAGFEVERMENFYMEGPKILTYLYCGRATPK